LPRLDFEYHPRYSPDAQRIAFESNRSRNEEIWICRADGSHPVQLTTFPNKWTGSPSWSPDGQKIAFDSNVAGNWDICIIRSQGGQPTRLTTSETNEYQPSWSRDGKWIYYCSTRTGHAQVWKIPASGGTEVQVRKHGGVRAYESVDREDLYYTNQDGLWPVGNEPNSVSSDSAADDTGSRISIKSTGGNCHILKSLSGRSTAAPPLTIWNTVHSGSGNGLACNRPRGIK